jgi:hypothetical protein
VATAPPPALAPGPKIEPSPRTAPALVAGTDRLPARRGRGVGSGSLPAGASAAVAARDVRTATGAERNARRRGREHGQRHEDEEHNPQEGEPLHFGCHLLPSPGSHLSVQPSLVEANALGRKPKPQRRPTMTSQGTAHARFQRAIKRGHVLHAEIAARELGAISLSDALALCLLYERAGDPRFERAARCWFRPCADRPRSSCQRHKDRLGALPPRVSTFAARGIERRGEQSRELVSK